MAELSHITVIIDPIVEGWKLATADPLGLWQTERDGHTLIYRYNVLLYEYWFEQQGHTLTMKGVTHSTPASGNGKVGE
jgi:hypothetical protein